MTHALILNAIDHTEKLIDVMETENVMLMKHKRGEAYDDILKQKRALAAKVERLLTDIRANKESIKKDIDAQGTLPELDVVMNTYQTTARKNLILLKAAHQTTADMLNLFKRAVDKIKPKPKTYTKEGSIVQGASSGSLVSKDV